MSDLEAKFRVSLQGRDELINFFNGSEKSAKTFATNLSGELRRAGGELQSLASIAGRSLAAIGGLGAGVGFAAQAKGVLELRDSVSGIVAVAGLADDQIGSLKDQLYATADATHQFGSALSEGLNEFVARTGDIEAGRKQLELFGRVATAVRGEVKEIAVVGGEFRKLGISDMATGFAVLAKQSDVGAVELKDLVSQGPRLFSAGGAAGLHGVSGLRELGALAQVTQQSTGNVERTSTAIEAAFRDIGMHSSQLQQSGITVFDKNGTPRDRIQVLLDIIRKARGREDVLQQHSGGGLFDSEGMRVVQMLAKEFRETGGFHTFESFRDVAADSSVIDRKFDVNSATGLSKLKQAQIAAQREAEKSYGGTLESLTNLAPQAAAFATAHPVLLGAAGLGARVAGGLAGRALFGRAGGTAGAALGGAATEGLEAMSGAQKVFVVNFPPGGLGGAGGGAGGGVAEKIGEAIAEKAKLALIPRLFASIATGGTGALIAGAGLGIAGSLAAIAYAGGQLGGVAKKLDGEIHERAQTRLDLQEENRKRKNDQAADATVEQVRRIGRYGGRITGAMAGTAARTGLGVYGQGAAFTIEEYREQQLHLAQLGAGFRNNISPSILKGDVASGGVEGAPLILASLMRDPAFAKGSAKQRAGYIESLLSANEKEAQQSAHYKPAGNMVGSDIPFGPAAPTAAQSVESWTSGLTQALSQLGDVLGLKTLNITINGDDVSVQGGTRSPEVMLRRGGAG